ncbi:hypothetical protein ABI138_12410 [Faecalibacterium prausnitzii]|uniref:hypothetical protein n=1 Tax=Faecalibacterium TaxID=216851 RepID=UPI0032AECCC0
MNVKFQRSKDAAVAYHSSYYAEKFKTDSDKKLVGVYIDITGNKEIYKRPEMVHLLKDCKKGAVNLIFSQTRAYLAANTCDFCFLLKYLRFAEERSEVYCNHAVCCGASHVL